MVLPRAMFFANMDTNDMDTKDTLQTAEINKRSANNGAKPEAFHSGGGEILRSVDVLHPLRNAGARFPQSFRLVSKPIDSAENKDGKKGGPYALCGVSLPPWPKEAMTRNHPT